MVTRFFLLPLLVTSVSFFILIFPSPITSLSSLLHVSATSVIFVAYVVLDFDTAPTIGTSVYSKLEYCNSMYYCLLQTQLNRLQHIQNALAHSVVAQLPGPPILTIFSNHCTGSRYRNTLKTKLLPPRITFSSLLLHITRTIVDLTTLQPSQSTRSSALVTLL